MKGEPLSLFAETISRGPEEVKTGPTSRLVVVGSGYDYRSILKYRDRANASILISYAYLKSTEKARPALVRECADWVLDSGAYTAYTAGKPVDLVEYTEYAKHLLATDPKLTEVFALDVIGDGKQSLKNYEYMWNQGVPAVPIYHVNSPIDHLTHIASTYPKFALGGGAKVNAKRKSVWTGQCFKHVWKHVGPSRIHGLAYSPAYLNRFPFHSVDASSWQQRTLRYGVWKKYGYAQISKEGYNLGSEIEINQREQRKARQLWSKEMATITENVKKRFNV